VENVCLLFCMDVVCHHMGKRKFNLYLNPMALNLRKSNLHKIIILVNRMVRRIFRPNMEEAKAVWRKLLKEELDKF